MPKIQVSTKFDPEDLFVTKTGADLDTIPTHCRYVEREARKRGVKPPFTVLVEVTYAD